MTETSNTRKLYKPVIIKIETDAQYQSIKPVLKRLKNNKILFDVYIPVRKDNVRNVNKMHDRTAYIIKQDGFTNIVRSLSIHKHYHLALIAPHYEEGLNSKYNVKYSYGLSMSVKPNQTHKASMLNHYHGYIVHNARDAEIFSVFCKTHIVPDLKHIGYQRTKDSKAKKPTILFLPSWEDQGSLGWIVSAIEKLKKDHRIIVKLHPFGDFGAEIPVSVEQVKRKIQTIADEFYDGEALLSELLGTSDLVISGISGAVFDSLYKNVPVLIYSKNIHTFDAEGIVSACVKYTDEGYISNPKTIDGLLEEVPAALTEKYLYKQKELASNIFNQNFSETAVDSWMSVIEQYLNDQVDQEYVALHDTMTNEFWQYKDQAEKLRSELIDKDHKIATLQSEINSFLETKRSVRLLVGNLKRKIKK